MERSESSSFESEIDSDSTSFESTSSVKKSASAAVVTSTATMDDLIDNLPSDELKAEFSDLTSAQKNVLLTIYQSDAGLFSTFISEEIEGSEPSEQTIDAIAKILDTGEMATFESIMDDDTGDDTGDEGASPMDFVYDETNPYYGTLRVSDMDAVSMDFSSTPPHSIPQK